MKKKSTILEFLLLLIFLGVGHGSDAHAATISSSSPSSRVRVEKPKPSVECLDLATARFKRSYVGQTQALDDSVLEVVVENKNSIEELQDSTTSLPPLTDIPRKVVEAVDSISRVTPSRIIDFLGEHDTYLPDEYNKLEIPKPEGTTSIFGVWVSLNIMSVLEINELKETIHLQMESTVSWYDGKIAEENRDRYEYNVTKSLDLVYLDRIWHPDLYMENLVEMATPSFIGAPISLRFRPIWGEMFYKARLSPVVKCHFTFVYYPADTQKCHFVLRSYSYQSQELKLYWLRDVNMSEVLVANFELFIATFKSQNITEQFDVLDVTYDTLKFTLTARRKLSYHLIQTYLPSSLFIVITWLCFLLPPSMLEARMGISMTTLLTLTAMFASVRSNAPVVSYVKAIDIWMVGCIFFVFFTLVEFATMIWIRHRYETQRAHAEQKLQKDIESKALIESNEVKPVAAKRKPRPLYVVVGKFIDKYAIIAYSLSFITFTVLYWSWLLIYAEYFSFMTNKSEVAEQYDFSPSTYFPGGVDVNEKMNETLESEVVNGSDSVITA